MTDIKNVKWVPCSWFHEEEDIDEEEYQDSYNEDGPTIPKIIGFGPSIIVTPFGPVNEDDIMNPVFDTEFFQCHTNFNLSKKILEDITKVEGVEFLKVMSRYRFIIGIGIMFDSDKVKSEIDKSLGVKTETEIKKIDRLELSEVAERSLECIVDDIVGQVPSDKRWLAYIFPNGEHIIKVVKDDTEFTIIWNNFSRLAEESNGVIVSSEDAS